jgi:ribonuclease HI
MRIFTDGSCIGNGRKGAKAGFAVWVPDHPSLSIAERVPADQPQTNNRAELSAIHRAARILDEGGYHDSDVVIYTDSQYSIDCLTKWLPGWRSRGWKTAGGGDVLHRDLIESTSTLLSKCKSYRFHHVRAHTGGGDDLSVNNDRVDRMAYATVDETVVVPPAVAEASADILPGCPLRLVGPPVSQPELTAWIRANLSAIDAEILDKHLYKAFAEVCKIRDVTLTKQTIQRVPMIRAEVGHLQISPGVTERNE